MKLYKRKVGRGSMGRFVERWTGQMDRLFVGGGRRAMKHDSAATGLDWTVHIWHASGDNKGLLRCSQLHVSTSLSPHSMHVMQMQTNCLPLHSSPTCIYCSVLN